MSPDLNDVASLLFNEVDDAVQNGRRYLVKSRDIPSIKKVYY